MLSLQRRFRLHFSSIMHTNQTVAPQTIQITYDKILSENKAKAALRG